MLRYIDAYVGEAKILPIRTLSIDEWSWLHMIMGDTVEEFGLVAPYIGNDKVLLCELIVSSQFDERSDAYETGEVKQKLDKWFKDMKERRR